MAFRVSSNGHIYLWLTGVPMCLRGVDNGGVLDLRRRAYRCHSPPARRPHAFIGDLVGFHSHQHLHECE